MLMKLRVLVSVYLDAKCYSAQKIIFSRVVESECLFDDFMTIYRACRWLFGVNCIVDFRIQDYAAV